MAGAGCYQQSRAVVWLKSPVPSTDSIGSPPITPSPTQDPRATMDNAASSQDLRYCPHCAEPTQNAPLPQMASDAESLITLGTGQPPALRRGYYCLQCRGIWQSVEVPADYLDSLRDYGPRIEELQRQIAVLRFMLASLRQQQQAPPAAMPPQDRPRLAA